MGLGRLRALAVQASRNARFNERIGIITNLSQDKLALMLLYGPFDWMLLLRIFSGECGVLLCTLQSPIHRGLHGFVAILLPSNFLGEIEYGAGPRALNIASNRIGIVLDRRNIGLWLTLLELPFKVSKPGFGFLALVSLIQHALELFPTDRGFLAKVCDWLWRWFWRRLHLGCERAVCSAGLAAAIWCGRCRGWFGSLNRFRGCLWLRLHNGSRIRKHFVHTVKQVVCHFLYSHRPKFCGGQLRQKTLIRPYLSGGPISLAAAQTPIAGGGPVRRISKLVCR